MGKYFVKDKKVHKFPPKCDTEHLGEKIYGSPPKGYVKCPKCFELSFTYGGGEKIS